MKLSLIALFLFLPTLALAQDKVGPSGRVALDWGVSGGAAMCINGDWTSTRTDVDIPLTWGGRAGVVGRIIWHNTWTLESTLNLCYVNQKFPTIDPRIERIEKDQWSLSLPVVAGYRFNFGDEAGIMPVAGIEPAWNFYIDNVDTPPLASVPRWKNYDIRVLVGAGFIVDRHVEIHTVARLGVIDQYAESSTIMACRRCLSSEITFTLNYFF